MTEHSQDDPAPKRPEAELGFGKVASAKTSQRLINRDGSFNVHRQAVGFFTSAGAFQHMLSMSWGRFLGLAALGYFLLNLSFALLYVLVGLQSTALAGTEEHGLWSQISDAFYFSVQTSSTIGYGRISPESSAANLVVTLESFVGLIGVAMITGLVFARFSRPMAHILYSDRAVVAPYRGGRALMFRLANARSNQILNPHIQVVFSYLSNENGSRVRKFGSLDLERDTITFLALNWTIVHPIDSQSPLHNVTAQSLADSEIEIMILLTGMDETFSQEVHSRTSYRADEIVFGEKFESMFEFNDEQGVIVNFDRLNATTTVGLPPS